MPQPPSPQSSAEAPTDVTTRVGVFVAISMALFAFVSAFTSEKLFFLYKDVLHLSASDVASLAIILGIPAYLRAFMGAGADLYPLWGYHRRTYFAVSAMVMSVGYIGLSLIPHYHYAIVVCLVLVAGSGSTMAVVMLDAVMVYVGNLNGTVGRLQTIQKAVPLLLGLKFTSELRGYVTQHWSYNHCFEAAALVSLAIIPLALLIPERRVAGRREAHEDDEMHADRVAAQRADRAKVAASLRAAARTPGLWAMVGYIFYLILTPGTNTAQTFYCVDVLHFSKQLLGNLGRADSAGAIVGLLVFAAASRRLPVRAMVWGAFLGDCSLYLASMGLHDESSAYVVSFVRSMLAINYDLCLLTLAARACPPGIEGTVYGLVLAAVTLAANLGEKLGSSIYVYAGPDHHHSITHGWFTLLWFGFGFTVLAAVFIPFLPAWSRSNEPLHPAKVATDSASAP